jgi:hypothetical protein
MGEAKKCRSALPGACRWAAVLSRRSVRASMAPNAEYGALTTGRVRGKPLEGERRDTDLRQHHLESQGVRTK